MAPYLHNVNFNELRIAMIDCPVNIADKQYIDYELYVLFMCVSLVSLLNSITLNPLDYFIAHLVRLLTAKVQIKVIESV